MNIWIFEFWNNCIQQYNFETFPSLCRFKACVTFCSLRPPVASLPPAVVVIFPVLRVSVAWHSRFISVASLSQRISVSSLSQQLIKNRLRHRSKRRCRSLVNCKTNCKTVKLFTGDGFLLPAEPSRSLRARERTGLHRCGPCAGRTCRYGTVRCRRRW